MSTDYTADLKSIVVSGTISVEEVREIDSMEGYALFVLLGPTGSGKSSFIEAVASDRSLSLSSNKLEGCTQAVTIYRISNLRAGRLPIFIVDVPGFVDSRISAMGIVSMLKKLIESTTALYLFRILYVTPINMPRLPGSQRRLLRTFDALTGVDAADCITIVSSMWDTISGETAQKRAERNLNQLRDIIWKDYIDKGSHIVKFHNNQESALTILDEATRSRDGRSIRFQLQETITSPLRETPFAPNIHDDLQERIQGLRIQEANIQSDLQMAVARSDRKLQLTLDPELKEVQHLLAKFEQELREFGPPPGSQHPDTTLPNLPSASPIVPSSDPESQHSPHNEEIPEDQPLPQPSHSIVKSRGLITRAVDSMKRLGTKLHKRRGNH
ncbi:hypothetical protein BJ165DRAFT_1533842 [Panaeolus papilionaceus]|nr:hypothetical protein BJ165DRAFT_1533842 [Panaeolus papilionaceus]